MKTEEKETLIIHRFSRSVDHITLPALFNFPFYYDPHPLTQIATESLQQMLIDQNGWYHNFGLDPNKAGLIIGKMFGVMVVKDTQGKLGWIAAVSGKLGGRNDIPGFVPPIYDMLKDEGFYKSRELEINAETEKLNQIHTDPEYLTLIEQQSTAKAQAESEAAEARKIFNKGRKERKKVRKKALEILSEEEYAILHVAHKNESLFQQHEVKRINFEWSQRLQKIAEKVNPYLEKINLIKTKRKEMSIVLQHRLFDQYHFLNKSGEIKSVLEIFKPTLNETPPSGAGECAAPKLLQYAFANNLTPVCMGEFWWGTPPKSEVRKHKNYYPACRGKCEPILTHMLEGLPMDDNPLLNGPQANKVIETIYEDESFAVINKPHELLSVPGKSIEESVYLRMKQKYPNCNSPLIVHRLDMSTSGIMLIAKTKDAHKHLQKQFLKKTIKKEYIALLDGELKQGEGEINLPIRVDLNDRPRQLVCYEHGKKAQTLYKVLEVKGRKTRILFTPVTGRTHQLRIHSAHQEGLGIAIVGDDLYGVKSDRLYLHAAYIKLKHPETEESIEFSVEPGF